MGTVKAKAHWPLSQWRVGELSSCWGGSLLYPKQVFLKKFEYVLLDSVSDPLGGLKSVKIRHSDIEPKKLKPLGRNGWCFRQRVSRWKCIGDTSL